LTPGRNPRREHRVGETIKKNEGEDKGKPWGKKNFCPVIWWTQKPSREEKNIENERRGVRREKGQQL